MQLYQMVGKKSRFPELPHIIAALSERILHSLAMELHFLHPNELQLRYKICWRAGKQATFSFQLLSLDSSRI
jgi:hypothetical protein